MTNYGQNNMYPNLQQQSPTNNGAPTYPYPGSNVVQQQPQVGFQQPGQPGYQPAYSPMGPPQGMPPPQPVHIPNCPPGLEYLTMIDQILVHQKVELLEAFTGFETNNKYAIKNIMGQTIYNAIEDTDCCTRMCCGPSRPFDMKIIDNVGNEVIHLYRPLRCQGFCCPCCLQELEVYSPVGNIIGYVCEEWNCLEPKFSVQNASRETIFRITGPCCACNCCSDVDFTVDTSEGTNVGKISKQWTGLARETFTDADNFGITFPLDLDVTMKAVLLGACFLIDFMYFEKKDNN